VKAEPKIFEIIYVRIQYPKVRIQNETNARKEFIRFYCLAKNVLIV